MRAGIRAFKLAEGEVNEEATNTAGLMERHSALMYNSVAKRNPLGYMDSFEQYPVSPA